MKKIIIFALILMYCSGHAKKSELITQQPTWKHNGIYIVNKSEGYLTIQWDDHEFKLAPAKENTISKILVPVTQPKTEINISYSDAVPAHADLPTCRGGAHVTFKTNKRIVLYEIYGGHEDGKGPFNRPGTGIHCHIKLHHQRFTADHALERYPDLQ